VPVAKAGDPLGKLHSDYDVKGLGHRLKVVVPSKDRAGTAIGAEETNRVIASVEQLLHSHGGGGTTQTANGSWTDPVAGVVHEQVLVLETYASEPFDEPLVRPIVEMLLCDLNQEVAAITVNDKMLHFAR